LEHVPRASDRARTIAAIGMYDADRARVGHVPGAERLALDWRQAVTAAGPDGDGAAAGASRRLG